MHRLLIFLLLYPCLAPCQSSGSAVPVSVTIDGSRHFQTIDGIGVNINSRSWDSVALPPALNLLADTMKAVIWRVIVESVEKWEDVNDNDDPFTYNWTYYDSLYQTIKFKKAWSLIRFLNKKGITNNLLINFMGFAPKWMGIKVINPDKEDEFVEMLSSFFYYAIKKEHLSIGLIAPTNESDWYRFSEGPHLTAEQHARILHKLITRMQGPGIMNDIRIVGPDNAQYSASRDDFIPAMLRDSLIVSKLAHLSFHTYGGYNDQYESFIDSTSFRGQGYWVSEWNAWCDGCDEGHLGSYDYNFAAKSVRYLLELLGHGAKACLAWEGYDSYYEHHAPSKFSYWGLLEYDSLNKTYPPRKTFYAISQVSRVVSPGSIRISATSAPDSLHILSFYDPNKKSVSLVGINPWPYPVKLVVKMNNIQSTGNWQFSYTDANKNLQKQQDIPAVKKQWEVQIPAKCIFSLNGAAAGMK